MCGISGFWLSPQKTAMNLAVVAKAMIDRLIHRGPDGSGIWCDDSLGLALAHRRLAIVDLSMAGAQPMHSESGRYVLSFNGEVYNHIELRNELFHLGKSNWKSTSDTEVILAALESWGLEKTLSRIRGMFAISLFDRSEKQLYLIRDRSGEKPLYYGDQSGSIIFGSELKALAAHPDFEGRIDPVSVATFFRRGYVVAPYSIYNGIKKVRQGHYIRIAAKAEGGWQISEVRYYNMPPRSNEFVSRSFSDVKADFKSLFTSVVKEQLQADVPVGVFLSGGIDSSLVAAAAQQCLTSPVHTYCIGFDDQLLNEAVYAKNVASYLGTTHHEMYISEKQALDVVGAMGLVYDEPFADSSQIPSWWVSHLTKKHCTVALSGDGGDELFGGYQRYQWNLRVWQDMKRSPLKLRIFLGKVLSTIPIALLEPVYRSVVKLRHTDLAKKNKQIDWALATEMLSIDSLQVLYEYAMAIYPMPEQLIASVSQSELNFRFQRNDLASDTDELHYMMDHDLTNYLPDDILVKVDRATMANSLEARAPFLDARLVEFSRKLPPTLCINKGRGKYLLRESLADWMPRELIDRPKQGFGPPLARWLRGPLKEFAMDLLQMPGDDAFCDASLAKVRTLMHEHCTFDIDRSSKIWAALMYLNWRSHTAIATTGGSQHN